LLITVAPGDRTIEVRVTDSTGAIGQTSVLVGLPFDPPGNLTAKIDPGGQSATVMWTPPVNTGGSPLAEYVLVTDPPTPTQTLSADTTSASAPGLAFNTSYTVSVYARDTGGAQSQPAATTVATPGPPPPPAGSQLWVNRYNAAFSGDGAHSVAITPDGSTSVVTGVIRKPDGGTEAATVAYDTSTGAQRWVSLYDTGGGANSGYPSSVAITQDGTTVVVTGDGSTSAYATVAYNISTGAQLWASQYDGGPAWSLAITPDGTTAIVTGQGYATVAYSTSTGAQLWSAATRVEPSPHLWPFPPMGPRRS